MLLLQVWCFINEVFHFVILQKGIIFVIILMMLYILYSRSRPFRLEPETELEPKKNMAPASASARAGNSLTGFLSDSSCLRKNERMSDSLKKRAICSKNELFAHLHIFGERPERFAHGRSFLVSNLSESLILAHFW